MTSSNKSKIKGEENLSEQVRDIDELEKKDLSVEEDLTSELTDHSLQDDIKSLKSDKINSFDLYKILIDTRKFEIENFWKRTVFFWGTIAILLAGYFNAKNSEDYLVFVSYLGFFYNFIFSLSLRGSKYWQEHWEVASIYYEKALDFKLFRWKLREKIQEDNKTVFFTLRPYRFSVSKLTMILSDITLILWVILIIKDINSLATKKLIHFQFSFKNQVDFFSIAVVFIPIICISYLMFFLFRGTKKHEKKQE